LGEVCAGVHRQRIGQASPDAIEKKAKRNNINTLLANISSKNQQSLNFHGKNGFAHCGTFKNVGNKQGQTFHMVWMQKDLKKQEARDKQDYMRLTDKPKPSH
jgi:phosphinothricin acetyltransferase